MLSLLLYNLLEVRSVGGGSEEVGGAEQVRVAEEGGIAEERGAWLGGAREEERRRVVIKVRRRNTVGALVRGEG